MKEKIFTIPIMDAFKHNDECPFCFLEKNAEEEAMNSLLGSQCAYMLDDVRAKTDQAGFCRNHYKKMYDYGNRVGIALVISTHLNKTLEELGCEMDAFVPTKSSFGDRFKKGVTTNAPAETNIGKYIDKREKSCYICQSFEENYDRYVDTFFYMYKKTPEFVKLFKESKGFCLPHFRDLVEVSATKLTDAEKKEFYPLLFSLMRDNLDRVKADVDHFVVKMDYSGRDLPWENAKDSVPRAMQKLESGYPSAPALQADK